jgi:hypothetical protein
MIACAAIGTLLMPNKLRPGARRRVGRTDNRSVQPIGAARISVLTGRPAERRR